MRREQATLVFGVRERFGRGDHPCADPHTLGAMRKRLGDVRAGGDAPGREDHHRLDGANDAPQQRHRPDDALVVSASLPALRDDGVDARSRGLHGLFDGGRLLPDAATRGVQRVHPRPRRNVHVEHDQLHAFRHADIDMGVGRGRTKRRGVMQQIDAEEALRPFRNHADERLRAGRRFDRIAQHADASRIGHGGHQRRIRDEPHPRAHERIPDAILARESRAQDASTAVPVRQLVESTVPGATGAAHSEPRHPARTPSSSEQRQHPPPIELGLFHVRFPTPIRTLRCGECGRDAQ